MTPQFLQRFKEVYCDEFGEQLSDQETLAAALQILGLFRAVYRPIPMAKGDVYHNFKMCYKEDSGPTTQ